MPGLPTVDDRGEQPDGASGARAPGVAASWRAGDVRALITRHGDLALAGLVISIVAMMIVPLPAFVLDLLISLNIAVAVTLLLISIYISDALKIATFPTLLLLTTLFRLALEVSATRLILLKANAGAVIHAFGGFVVAGNLVVGVVVFLILTLIQFIVISKGAERVAEVAARFTLDAMPGKQLSIDADLRAGHIDAAEARRRRADLTRESQLFGAMDGAMKFVKGDAIAGIVVLAVNIVGGLVIGIVQRGMDVATAARTFTRLTIGEGLVAQIPALVISTAAGIVVTRVASREEGANLGRDIGGEILAHPKALAVAAALLGLLGLVPGLPAVPFLALAAILGFVAWRLLAVAASPRLAIAETATPEATAGSSAADLSLSLSLSPAAPPPSLTPVTLELSAALSVELGIAADGGARFAAEHLAAARARLFDQTGLRLPAVRIVVAADADLAGRRYRWCLNEIPVARGEVPPDASGAGNSITPMMPIIADLVRVMRRHGHELVGIQETQSLLDALGSSHPALVREVAKLVSPALLADVLRRLAAEGISLRYLPEILGALADAAPSVREPAALTERARAALRRAITFAHAGETGVLTAVAIDPLIEDTLREAIRPTDNGGHLALEPEASRDIRAAVDRALAAVPAGGAAAVIVTAGDLRRHVRRLIEVDHPELAVLSYAELSPEVQIATVARVTV